MGEKNQAYRLTIHCSLASRCVAGHQEDARPIQGPVSARGLWWWELDEWTLYCVLAALSAEPETLSDLDAALGRYLLDPRLAETGQPLDRIDEAAVEHGRWCHVDLIGRTIVAGPNCELPQPGAAYARDSEEDSHPNTGTGASWSTQSDSGDSCAPEDRLDGFPIVWFDIRDNWQITQAGSQWQQLVAERSLDACKLARIDARAVLFGPPLLEYIADQIRMLTDAELALDDDARLERVREIHANWYLAARTDLGGKTPRDTLLDDRERLDRDLWHRSEQWGRQGFPPPGLELNAAAYRYGGFGTNEIVLYFDLVRELIDVAWQHVARRRRKKRSRPSRKVLMAKLADCLKAWLRRTEEGATGDITHGELIELERQRIPKLATPDVFDCNCPICRAQAEGGFGIGFEWCDGHQLELEDVFAFSLTRDRDTWEADQAEYDTLAIAADAEPTENAIGAGANKPSADDPRFPEPLATVGMPRGDDSVWKASYVNWESIAQSDIPVPLRKQSVGYPLAEIIDNILNASKGVDGRVRAVPDTIPGRADRQQYCDDLNDAFSRFCNSQDTATEQSAAHDLGEHLEAVAMAFPKLVPKSADLQSRLDEILRLSRDGDNHA